MLFEKMTFPRKMYWLHFCQIMSLLKYHFIVGLLPILSPTPKFGKCLNQPFQAGAGFWDLQKVVSVRAAYQMVYFLPPPP